MTSQIYFWFVSHLLCSSLLLSTLKAVLQVSTCLCKNNNYWYIMYLYKRYIMALFTAFIYSAPQGNWKIYQRCFIMHRKQFSTPQLLCSQLIVKRFVAILVLMNEFDHCIFAWEIQAWTGIRTHSSFKLVQINLFHTAFQMKILVLSSFISTSTGA